MARLDENKQKLLALGSVSKLARIDNYRVARWFYGQSQLESRELKRLIEALSVAEKRTAKLLKRAKNELAEILNNKTP